MSFLFFLIILSVLVLIHELGHFLAARAFGIKAEEFGFGFPPRLIGVVKDRGRWKIIGPRDHATYDRTIWSLNWLPLGGFVKIKGEQEAGMHDPDALHAKPIWQRMVVIAAGVIMNWLLAIALFTIIFVSGTRAVLEDLPARAKVSDPSVAITQVLEDSPASRGGIQPGDEVVSFDGKPVTTAAAVREGIREHGTRELELGIRRKDTEQTIRVTPEMLKELDHTGIGVGIADVGTVSLGVTDAFVNAVSMTARLTKGILFAFGDLVRDIAVHQSVSKDISGPVGIAVMAGSVAKQGVAPLLQFAALLSINLAVVNFLPIPALDGGRFLFLFIEKLRRRPLSRKLEIAIHNVAFLLLIVLILLVTIRDLSRVL